MAAPDGPRLKCGKAKEQTRPAVGDRVFRERRNIKVMEAQLRRDGCLTFADLVPFNYGNVPAWAHACPGYLGEWNGFK